jgi:YegS/Rv2252/BmrU family lipid kinase
MTQGILFTIMPGFTGLCLSLFSWLCAKLNPESLLRRFLVSTVSGPENNSTPLNPETSLPAGRAWEKTLLIFNPQSGHGLFPPFFQQILGIKKQLLHNRQSPVAELHHIEAMLAKYNVHPESVITASSEEATALARKCAQKKYDLVIAVGGDGTINAVVNGLAGSNTLLAVIPTGTINIFGLQMNIPTSLAEACSLFEKGRIITMDLGKVNQRYFVCMAGIGFDAYVIKATDRNFKKVFGVIALAFSAVVGFFIYPFRSLKAKIDHNEKIHKGYFMIVGNMKYYGGDLVLLPHAEINDGYLDVCLFKKRGFFNFLGYLWGLRRGKLEKYLDVEYLQCKSLDIINRRQFVHLDGEYMGRKKLHIKVVPSALRILVQ